jgi:hypothetical protein
MNTNGYDNEKTSDINNEHGANQENMTVYECIRKIKEAGGSYELLADGKVKLRMTPTVARFIKYVNERHDDIKFALRVQTWYMRIDDTDELAGWKRAMDAGLMDPVKVRVYSSRNYMEIDYIALAEDEVLSRVFYPEDFDEFV